MSSKYSKDDLLSAVAIGWRESATNYRLIPTTWENGVTALNETNLNRLSQCIQELQVCIETNGNNLEEILPALISDYVRWTNKDDSGNTFSAFDKSGNATFTGNVTANSVVCESIKDKITALEIEVANIATIEHVSTEISEALVCMAGIKQPDINAEVFNDYDNNSATGNYSHAEGYSTSATGDYSHAEGKGTIATIEGQHVQGKYNESGDFAHIIGNGESETDRSNAYTLDWDGNGWFAGDVEVCGSIKAEDVTVKDQSISELIDNYASLVSTMKSVSEAAILIEENRDTLNSLSTINESVTTNSNRIEAIENSLPTINDEILSEHQASISQNTENIGTIMEKLTSILGEDAVQGISGGIIPDILSRLSELEKMFAIGTVDPDKASNASDAKYYIKYEG